MRLLWVAFSFYVCDWIFGFDEQVLELVEEIKVSKVSLKKKEKRKKVVVGSFASFGLLGLFYIVHFVSEIWIFVGFDEAGCRIRREITVSEAGFMQKKYPVWVFVSFGLLGGSFFLSKFSIGFLV